MKKLLVVLLLCGLYATVHAQNNDMDAIAAYQMAEESFEARRYSDALKHIKTSQTILGTANSKILYLEILILAELGKTNPDYLVEQQTAIHAFEHAHDIAQFSQEKRLEVAKIKVGLGEKIRETQETKRKRREFVEGLPKLGTPINEFLEHPYLKKYKEALSNGQKKRLLKGKFVYFGVAFTDDRENECFVSYVSTDGNGYVNRYSLKIEIAHADQKKAMIDLFDFGDDSSLFDGIANLKKIRVNYGQKLMELTKRTSHRRRNGKKVDLNYMSCNVDYTIKTINL